MLTLSSLWIGLTSSKLMFMCLLKLSSYKFVVQAQESDIAPNIHINNYILDVVNEFTYLGSTMCSNLTLELENRTIGKAFTAMSRLSKRLWENTKLTLSTKIKVYQACVPSTLLHSSEAWPTYSHQERRLNSFHQRCLRKIMGITWKDQVPKHDVCFTLS